MTTLLESSTTLKRPVQARDRQRQMSSLMGIRDAMLRIAVVEHRREFPDDALNGYTYEVVLDGAGAKHHNLTAHFYDQREEVQAVPQLDPRNLNGAEQTIFGQVLTAAELAEKGIGVHDTRYKGF